MNDWSQTLNKIVIQRPSQAPAECFAWETDIVPYINWKEVDEARAKTYLGQIFQSAAERKPISTSGLSTPYLRRLALIPFPRKYVLILRVAAERHPHRHEAWKKMNLERWYLC